MKKATQNKRNGGPSVFRFKARIVQESKKAKTGSGALLNIPTAVSKKLGSMTLVEGRINGHAFRAALESDSSGGRSLRVNKAMRKGAAAQAGDAVDLAILGPEPAPVVPSDLRVAFSASAEAKLMWKDLTLDARRIWVRWIEAAKTSETRARRVRRTVEQLAEGKRRPCCVNVYEFMTDRVQW